METDELVQVKDLEVFFHTDEGIVRAVDGVSFSIGRGETLGVLGESGCGKSVTARSLLNLIPRPRGRIHGGEIWLNKEDGSRVDILSLNPFGKEIGKIRGREIAMIFQEPMTALNPVNTIGHQIMEAILLHQRVSKKEAREKAIDMLERVGISSPSQAVDKYPHEFSGGMRQRAMIAMALSCNPRLLIADEPTTALDVTIASQILELLQELKEEMGMSILFITHDLGVIGEIAERVIVMYTGKIVESGSCVDIFHNPKHPYTQKLLESRPRIGQKEPLSAIAGSVPSPYHLPQGCRFAPRCEFAMDQCVNEPPLRTFGQGHHAQCWLHEGNEQVG